MMCRSSYLILTHVFPLAKLLQCAPDFSNLDPIGRGSVASASLVVYALPYINLQPFVYKTRNVR